MVGNKFLFVLLVAVLSWACTHAVDCSQKYTVVSGDSCYAIAQRFGLDLNGFMQANNIQSDCGNLQAKYFNLNFIYSI